MNIISIYPNFSNRGGAQDVALLLASKLNNSFPVVLTETSENDIVSSYKDKAKYHLFSFKKIKSLATRDSIFLSHHRKSTTLLLLFRIFLFFEGKKLNIVHVAHNTFTNLRLLSFFPKHIIAVSNGVKMNLISYFGVSSDKVTVIFNGIVDKDIKKQKREYDGKIKILLAGRVCPVKQQVELVRRLKGKLLSQIHFYFAGVGEDLEQLKIEIGDSSQFHSLGHISMEEHLDHYDYVFLYSQKEGLPLSLIEGCMFGKPLITNDLPAVLDVNKDGVNGFVYSDFESLIEGLNKLPFPDSKEYLEMSQRSRLIYEENFTEDKMIYQYRTYLGKILDNNNAR